MLSIKSKFTFLFVGNCITVVKMNTICDIDIYIGLTREEINIILYNKVVDIPHTNKFMK